ncbi:MAG: ABC transporter permease [Limnochordia bacterium]|jgi:spermidine/putrescine transport system permease protein|nr:ABC transporter permease [Limnochordia bacterium]MDI9464017.1 ABC transporter permease [Bacillota bacterium]NLO96296.1 ABC transporter permease [Bacillota bacterium]HAI52396.1 putrescine ABC transporter permease PotI [Bacillota bacterium]HAN93985.1 putrescine ABC transporter permease PotI [Bacillota bacterium]
MRGKASRFGVFYLSLFFVVLYLPVLSVVLYSFNASSSTAQWTGWSLEWYRQLLRDRVIGEAFKVSIQVAVLTAILSAVLGTFTAVVSMWVTARMKRAIQGIMILPLIVPEVALGVSLLFFFNALRLPFGILTLVLSHSLFCVPYVYIMVRLRLQEIDAAILESALDLGASVPQMVRTIILPLVAPSIVTASLLCLAMSLDDVIISTYMSGPRSTTLPVHIFSMMRVGVTPKVNALCTLILVGTFFIIGLSQIITKQRRFAK